jgi:iron complex transport system ATP-binding protein
MAAVPRRDRPRSDGRAPTDAAPAAIPAPPLRAEQLRVRLGAREVVCGVDLDVHAGSLVALLGPNGAGKSSTLSALAGDLPASGGRVHLDARTLQAWSAGERARRRAVLPQHAALAFDLPVLDVVCLGRAPFGDGRTEAETIAIEALELVELGHKTAASYLALSGGERQRVQVARLLAQAWPAASERARTCLLDEPVASLDPRQQHRVLSALRTLANEGVAVVVVLHDVTLAAAYADRLVMMRDGRVLADGAPRDVCCAAVLEATYDTEFAVHVGADGRPIVSPRACEGVGFGAGAGVLR